MLLILSSGLSTAGGFDLRQVGWDASPATVAAQLKARGLLPVLAGWQVVFSGLGDTAGTQPPLPLPQRTTLTSYWMAICHAAGAPSCHADEMTRPDPPSRSKTAVPVVPVPTVQSVRGPHGSTSISIPNDEFRFRRRQPARGRRQHPRPAGRQGPFRPPDRHHHRLRVPRRRVPGVQPGAVPGPRADGARAPGRRSFQKVIPAGRWMDRLANRSAICSAKPTRGSASLVSKLGGERRRQ
jgi:hypothetical protein